MGLRNSHIVIIHESTPASKVKFEDMLNETIGVDSGQAGFFDTSRDTWSDKQYSEVCALTLETELDAGVLDQGAVSASGYGDGTYRCRYAKLNDEVVAAEIRFI